MLQGWAGTWHNHSNALARKVPGQTDGAGRAHIASYPLVSTRSASLALDPGVGWKVAHCHCHDHDVRRGQLSQPHHFSLSTTAARLTMQIRSMCCETVATTCGLCRGDKGVDGGTRPVHAWPPPRRCLATARPFKLRAQTQRVYLRERHPHTPCTKGRVHMPGGCRAVLAAVDPATGPHVPLSAALAASQDVPGLLEGEAADGVGEWRARCCGWVDRVVAPRSLHLPQPQPRVPKPCIEWPSLHSRHSNGALSLPPSSPSQRSVTPQAVGAGALRRPQETPAQGGTYAAFCPSHRQFHCSRCTAWVPAAGSGWGWRPDERARA